MTLYSPGYPSPAAYLVLAAAAARPASCASTIAAKSGPERSGPDGDRGRLRRPFPAPAQGEVERRRRIPDDDERETTAAGAPDCARRDGARKQRLRPDRNRGGLPRPVLLRRRRDPCRGAASELRHLGGDVRGRPDPRRDRPLDAGAGHRHRLSALGPRRPRLLRRDRGGDRDPARGERAARRGLRRQPRRHGVHRDPGSRRRDARPHPRRGRAPAWPSSRPSTSTPTSPNGWSRRRTS